MYRVKTKLEAKLINDISNFEGVIIINGGFYIDIVFKGVKVHTFIFSKHSIAKNEEFGLIAVLECLTNRNASTLIDTCDIEEITEVLIAEEDSKKDNSLFFGTRRQYQKAKRRGRKY